MSTMCMTGTDVFEVDEGGRPVVTVNSEAMLRNKGEYFFSFLNFEVEGFLVIVYYGFSKDGATSLTSPATIECLGGTIT